MQTLKIYLVMLNFQLFHYEPQIHFPMNEDEH